ncbi:helix-turn-helix domain-containing protein [Lacibacterium aquatile]|uniref:Helix-turn-helix domain-containing protein n=1 Tax=Lacibacterium aquatile TaxID=1168082 RepID=A0ABW5DSA4_9PROT
MMKERQSEDIDKVIGDNIAAARNALGWKQSELADLAGVSRGTIGKIESHNSAGITTLADIADALGVPLHMLLMRGTDWKKLTHIQSITDLARQFLDSGSTFSQKVDQIERKSKSRDAKDRRWASQETSALVSGIIFRDEGEVTQKRKNSMIASAGMATDLIPNVPVLNGVIAAIISA